jgi:hypothetical protein
MKLTTQRLPCKLTRDETIALESNMAEILCVMIASVAKRALLDKQIAALHDRATALVAKRRAGTEVRDVAVSEKPSWRRKVVVMRRQDTRQKIGERPLTADDRQLLLVAGPRSKDSNFSAERACERSSARASARSRKRHAASGEG